MFIVSILLLILFPTKMVVAANTEESLQSTPTAALANNTKHQLIRFEDSTKISFCTTAIYCSRSKITGAYELVDLKGNIATESTFCTQIFEALEKQFRET